MLSDKKFEIKNNALLSSYTTFRLGGPCRGLINCQTPDELESAIQKLIKEQEDFILIGGGSNLVVSDQGIDTFVIRFVSSKPLIERHGTELIISGSTLLDEAALFAMENSLEGLNYASGIPGTVGGAVVGNAGAFGKQVGDYLKSVTLLSPQGIKKEVSATELGFRYRHSKLKETGDIVLCARFGLIKGERKMLRQERAEILKVRREKHPNLKKYPCAGSFFRNIEPTSKAQRRQAAGFFLEQAGAKDFKVGGAKIFKKHANIIIKSNGCTSQNVHDLHLKMAKAVKEKFAMDLVREVRFVGKFQGMPSGMKDLLW